MPTLDLTIYQTFDLTNYCSNNFSNEYRSRDRAATWISGAFNDTSDYDINITKADTTPDPPQEGPIQDSFSAQCLCTQDFTCDYNNLFDWWTDWLDSLDNCNDGPKAADANLLLTNWDKGGGLGEASAAVAGVGPDVAELDSQYEAFGYQTSHKRLNAAIHELGHCFINWDKSNCSHNDDDGVDEPTIPRLS